MELKKKDLGARISEFAGLETPFLLPVYNPNKPSISTKKMQEMGVKSLITNSYILWKKDREKVVSEGVHDYIDFDGFVMTDSGAFQLMEYGDIDVSNKEIIEFQKNIGVDAGVPLDIPGTGKKREIKANLEKTLERCKEAEEMFEGNVRWAGPLQGGRYLDLREKSAKAMAGMDFDFYALGSIVPQMNAYEFSNVMDQLHTVKQILPQNKPVHMFGAGHPMFFCFPVALGADIFDSASYALFAERKKYLTETGTISLEDLEELPCSCPVCSEYSASELDEKLLAEHNLWKCLEEIKRIKEHIKRNTLWELLETRARAHPALLKAFKKMKNYQKYLEELDVYTKKRFFWLSEQSQNRPELLRHQKRMQEPMHSKKLVEAFPFKEVPAEVLEMYPFGQRILPENPDEDFPEVTDLDKINGLAEYIYGLINAFDEDVRIKTGNTGRIRSVHKKNDVLASVRCSDGVLIPHKLSEKIQEETEGNRVVVNRDSEPFVLDGKSVFAKFVEECSEDVRAGKEVLIENLDGELLGSGTAELSAKEILDFDSGVAVSTRWTRSQEDQ